MEKNHKEILEYFSLVELIEDENLRVYEYDNNKKGYDTKLFIDVKHPSFHFVNKEEFFLPWISLYQTNAYPIPEFIFYPKKIEWKYCEFKNDETICFYSRRYDFEVLPETKIYHRDRSYKKININICFQIVKSTGGFFHMVYFKSDDCSKFEHLPYKNEYGEWIRYTSGSSTKRAI